MTDQSFSREIAHEQKVVDKAYQALDDLRSHYRREQNKIAAQGSSGTHQARTERDAFAAHYGDSAARLEQVEDRLVFGRLDLDDQSTRYIGRVGLRNEDDNGTEHQLLLDWRAPASRPFYQATALKRDAVARRRHISTRRRNVISLEDELLDIDSDLGESCLQGEGALMAAMSKGRGGHMVDIVSTIQYEQDQIIRSDLDSFVVVQGGPGTGKTAVALHRAAYLLYAHREKLASSGVLIVGPSKTFLRYIEKVLPGLGETGVVSATISELIPGIHPSKIESPEIAAVKGSLKWVKVARAAVADLQRMPAGTQELKVGSKTLVLTREMVERAMNRARRLGLTHNEARETYAKTLVNDLVNQYAQGDDDPDSLAWMYEEVRRCRDVRRAVNLCWMPTAPQTLLEKLYANPALLRHYGPDFSPEELSCLARPKGSPWTDADIPILDEFAELLGPHEQADGKRHSKEASRLAAQEIQRAQEAISAQGLGSGIVNAQMLAQRAAGEKPVLDLAEKARATRTWTYGHIVVDEAQELSALAWNMLLRRAPSLSFTAVGDLDQRSWNSKISSWYEALGPAGRARPKQYSLSISYRTPKLIMDLATEYLTQMKQRPTFPIRAARDISNCVAYTRCESGKLEKKMVSILGREREHLDNSAGAGLGKIAIIVAQNPTYWSKILQLPGRDPINDRVVVLSAAESKGLEFDTVVIIEPSDISQTSIGDMYVALTRPTQRLHLVYTKDLPPGLDKN